MTLGPVVVVWFAAGWLCCTAASHWLLDMPAGASTALAGVSVGIAVRWTLEYRRAGTAPPEAGGGGER